MQMLCLLSVEVLAHQKCLKTQNTDFRVYSSFIPTKHHFNRPPECREDKSNSSTMKLFSHLVHKQESLAGNGGGGGGGGGPEGEDCNTAEEIKCRHLVFGLYLSSEELQKEFAV